MNVNRNTLLEKLRRDRNTYTSLRAQSFALGMNYSTLYRIINGEVKAGSVETWEKIAMYLHGRRV